MRINTHRAIAKAAACAVGLRGGPVLEALLKGVADPDYYPEEEIHRIARRRGRVYLVKRRVRHHTRENFGRIMRYIWRARRLWLEGRFIEAAYALGWAMHYTHDMCIHPLAHNSESKMRGIEVPLNLVTAAAASAECSPSFLERILFELRPSTLLEDAVADAAAVSASMLAATFGPANPPENLIEELRRRKSRHVAFILAVAASAGPLLVVLPIASLVLFIAAVAFYAADGKRKLLKKR